MNPRIWVIAACLSMSLLAGQPARAETIDPVFRSDIERLLVVTGSTRAATQMVSLAAGQMLDGLRKSRPDISERAIAVTKEVLDTEFARAFAGPEGFTAKCVEIYARHFTHEEVSGILKFYESDLGKKMIGVMPTLIQESSVVGQEWAAANMPQIRAAVESRLRAEGFVK